MCLVSRAFEAPDATLANPAVAVGKSPKVRRGAPALLSWGNSVLNRAQVRIIEKSAKKLERNLKSVAAKKEATAATAAQATTSATKKLDKKRGR